MSYLAPYERKGLRSNTVGVGGRSVTYWESGDTSGPAIVMVHGLRGSYEGLSLLAVALEPAHVIMPVLPGYEGSDELSVNHTVGAYADWLDAFIGALGPVTVVVGHSFGAAITSEWAARYGTGERSLILINPVLNSTLVARLGQRAYAGFMKRAPSRIRRPILYGKWFNIAESRWLTKTTDPRLRRAIITARLAEREIYREAVVIQNIESVTGVSLSDNLHKTQARITIIGAEGDKFVSPKELKRLAVSLPNAELIMIDRTGHLSPIEEPERVAEVIRRVVSEETK